MPATEQGQTNLSFQTAQTSQSVAAEQRPEPALPYVPQRRSVRVVQSVAVDTAEDLPMSQGFESVTLGKEQQILNKSLVKRCKSCIILYECR